MSSICRSSSSRRLLRTTALLVIAAAAAGCSADAVRFVKDDTGTTGRGQQVALMGGQAPVFNGSVAVARAPLQLPPRDSSESLPPPVEPTSTAQAYPSGRDFSDGSGATPTVIASSQPRIAPPPMRLVEDNMGSGPAPYVPPRLQFAAAPASTYQNRSRSHATAPRPRALPTALRTAAASNSIRALPVATTSVVVRPATESSVYKVRRGDTLWAIARRHKTTTAALMQANDMEGTLLRPGQKLSLPGAAIDRNGRTVRQIDLAQSTDTPTRTASPRAPSAEAVSAAKKAVASASATRNPGAKVGPSTAGADDGRRNQDPSTTATTVARSVETGSPAARAEVQPAAYVPARSPRSDAAPAPMFIWPVRGTIVSDFGSKPGGERNDGINIAVGKGTAVRAARDGVVIYAGNELKSYGNLVLIRHSDGWVSAYAHNDSLLAKRGDTVVQGQTIARVGATGSVSANQLHFEIRNGQTPVDPMQHLPKI